jgi:hypothetical protein
MADDDHVRVGAAIDAARGANGAATGAGGMAEPVALVGMVDGGVLAHRAAAASVAQQHSERNGRPRHARHAICAASEWERFLLSFGE